MDELVFGDLRILVTSNALPHLFGEYNRRARLSESFAMDMTGGSLCWLGVSRGTSWPFLSVAQRYKAPGAGFEPGALYVSQTNILFIGAGTRLLAYRLDEPSRLWEEQTEVGFHGWTRHGDIVLMTGEQELATWDVKARLLWRIPMRDSRGFKIAEDIVTIEGGDSFNLAEGPKANA